MEKPHVLSIIRSGTSQLTLDELAFINSKMQETFKNGYMVPSPAISPSTVAYQLYADFIPGEKFPLDVVDFFERLRLDPAEWHLLMQVV